MANGHGGKRPGSGRKTGTKWPQVLERNRVEAEIRQRILKSAHRITDRMLQLAEGCSYLYRTVEDEKGRRGKPELVEDQEEIRKYIEGAHDPNEFYFITTEKPNYKALENLLDRGFGKPKQALDVKAEVSTADPFNISTADLEARVAQLEAKK